jgi:hypothetical protein
MSGIPIQGTLFANGNFPLARLDNIPQMVWDGAVPFSTIYTNANISTLTNGVTISLKGTGHTIDNKGSIYTNMQYISFNSADIARTINIAQDATLNTLPTLLNKVALQSQSTSFVVVNPFLSFAQIVYIGRICSLQCDSGISGAKFVSLTGNNQFVLSFWNANIVNAHVFDIADTATLQVATYNNCYVDPTAFVGGATANLVFIYLNNLDVFSPIYKSLFTSFAGNIYYVPISDANQLRNASNATWDVSINFSDFYSFQNIANLTGTLVVNLIGIGDHTIDNIGAPYTNMNRVTFQSLDMLRGINLAQDVTMDEIPILSNILFNSQSTAFVCVNPANIVTIMNGSTLATDPGVTGAKFLSYTSGGFFGKNISLVNSYISGDHAIDLTSTARVNFTLYNGSIINANSIYGSGVETSTSIYFNYDPTCSVPSPSSITNFTGAKHYLPLAVSNQVRGGALQLTDLTALQNWPYPGQMIVGQIGTAVDTGILYTLTTIGDPPSTQHVWDPISADVTYTNANPTPEDVGGIPAGSTFSVVPNSDMWTRLLYKYQAPVFSSFSISGQATTIEVGASISGAQNFIWLTTNSGNVATDSINIYDITGSATLFTGLANDGIEGYTFPSPIQLVTPGSYVWQIEGTNTDTPPVTFDKNFIVNWDWRMHSGASANATLTNSQILALANTSLATAFPTSVNFAGGSTYFWYWIPSSFTQPTIFRDSTTGFQIDMEAAVTQSVTNVNSVATNYKGYRSTYQLAVGTTVAVS